jgi:fluoroquinolone resistance protein
VPEKIYFCAMTPQFIEDQTFSKLTTGDMTPGAQTYENCKFSGCDFAQANFAHKMFIDCVFENCNLALADVSGTGLQNIRLKHCKLSGVNFTKSLDFLFEMHFEHCILDNAVFYKKKNKGAKFSDCSMVETDLTEADLTDAQFNNCNLNSAFFSRTILKNADFRTSYNFTIDPDNNVVKKARFSVHGLSGLLAKYDIRIE